MMFTSLQHTWPLPAQVQNYASASRYVEELLTPFSAPETTGRGRSSDAEILSWKGIDTMNDFNDATFWCVAIFGTGQVGRLLASSTASLNQSSVAMSAAGRSEQRRRRESWARFVTRLVIVDASTFPQVEQFASLLEALFPTNDFLTLSAQLHRFSSMTASVVLTSLCLQCPMILQHLRAVGGNWIDAVDALRKQTHEMAQQGRHQRTPADVVRACETLFRLSRAIWSVLSACPFLADFVSPLRRLLPTLRTIAEVIAPRVQHFAMSCEALSSRRPDLTRAIHAAANYSVDTAVNLIVFSTHSMSDRCARHCRAVESSLSEVLSARGGIVVSTLAQSRSFSIRDALLALSQPHGHANQPSHEGTGRIDPHLFRDALELLLPAGGNRAGRDHHAGFCEAVLLCVQALGIDLGEHGGVHGGVATSAAAPSPPASWSDDDAVLRDVLPDLPIAVLRAAIQYYDRDMERLVADALAGNLPPHVVACGNASACEASGDDGGFHRLQSMLDVLADADGADQDRLTIGRANDDDDDEDGQADNMRGQGSDGMTTSGLFDAADATGMGAPSSSADSLLHVRRHAHFIASLLYEDERDDGGDGGEASNVVRSRGARGGAAAVEDDDDAEFAETAARGLGDNDDEDNELLRFTNPNWRHPPLPPVARRDLQSDATSSTAANARSTYAHKSKAVKKIKHRTH